MELSYRLTKVTYTAARWTGDNLEEMQAMYPDIDVFNRRNRSKVVIRVSQHAGMLLAPHPLFDLWTVPLGDWLVRGSDDSIEHVPDDVYRRDYIVMVPASAALVVRHRRRVTLKAD